MEQTEKKKGRPPKVKQDAVIEKAAETNVLEDVNEIANQVIEHFNGPFKPLEKTAAEIQIEANREMLYQRNEGVELPKLEVQFVGDEMLKKAISFTEEVPKQCLPHVGLESYNFTCHKFNPEDVVWAVYYGGAREEKRFGSVNKVYKYRPVNVAIKEVIIGVNGQIFYRFNASSMEDCAECNVFLTKQECQDRCNALN